MKWALLVHLQVCLGGEGQGPGHNSTTQDGLGVTEGNKQTLQGCRPKMSVSQLLRVDSP